MRLARVRSRWVAVALAAALALLLAASLPFYAGSTPVEGLSWRMEHGRLTVRRFGDKRPNSLWVAGNTEGLRWSPELELNGGDNWKVTLPLWIPLAGALAWCYVAWRPRGTAPSS